MIRSGRRIGLVACLALWACASGLSSPEPQRRWIDPASQLRLYLKVLMFDRNIKARMGNELVIGILYAGLVTESRQARDSFARALADGLADFEGFPIRAVPIEYGKQAGIEASLAEEAIDVLYITPVGAYDLAPVSAACKARHIPTFTGMPEYIGRGVSVGFALKGRQAEVIIDLPNSVAEGSDFSARLLDMVTVVGGSPRGKAS